MKYMGSKRRIAKHILPIMLQEAEKHGLTTWIEPFVGGGNMIDKVPSSYKRTGYDINDHVIHAMIGIRDYLNELPDSVSEELYIDLIKSDPDRITSLIRFGCSFGGKFEGGFARGKGRNYWQETLRNAQKQSPLIQDVDFHCANYQDLDFKDCLIYCDPPYKGSTGYAVKGFKHDDFYEWCRNQAKKNIVFVSEYNMPDDFIEVWHGEIKTNFASSRKKATHQAIERLFLVKAI
jgi:DNA adenine methylase